MEKLYDADGSSYTLVKSNYRNNGATYIGLLDEEGEPYCDVSINLEFGNDKNIIALNKDFEEFADSELIRQLKCYLFKNYICDIPQGFQTYGLYTLKNGILDDIPTLK